MFGSVIFGLGFQDRLGPSPGNTEQQQPRLTHSKSMLLNAPVLYWTGYKLKMHRKVNFSFLTTDWQFRFFPIKGCVQKSYREIFSKIVPTLTIHVVHSNSIQLFG